MTEWDTSGVEWNRFDADYRDIEVLLAQDTVAKKKQWTDQDQLLMSKIVGCFDHLSSVLLATQNIVADLEKRLGKAKL